MSLRACPIGFLQAADAVSAMSGSETSRDWQVVIFIVNDKANHVGLSIPMLGLADLSLLGARISPWDGSPLPKGGRVFFDMSIDRPDAALAFLRQPGLLTPAIIAQEKLSRGWHLTCDAPDYVRTMRCRRSLDPSDMNCVEWIVHAMELGGRDMPFDILTPTDLHHWCRANLAGRKAG